MDIDWSCHADSVDYASCVFRLSVQVQTGKRYTTTLEGTDLFNFGDIWRIRTKTLTKPFVLVVMFT